MKKIYAFLSVLCAAFIVMSCSNNDVEVEEELGYLKLEVNTLVSTHTRAVPAGYNAKTLHVELRNADGSIALQTDDFENDANFKGNLTLAPGTYTIVAHSANWDGSDSGFGIPYYAGSTTVTVEAKKLVKATVTCTLANVKVTVNFDNSFIEAFKSAMAIVTSDVSNVAPVTFVMKQTVGSAYFPVGALNFMISVTNNSDQTFVQNNKIEDVKARDHIIITYKVAEAGKQGGVTVYTDDAAQTYTYEVEVPRKSSTSLQAFTANAWARYAELSGKVTAKTSTFEPDKVVLQWKTRTADEWTTVPNSALTNNGDDYTCKLSGLTPETAYTYRFVYDSDAPVNSNEINFTTEAATPLTNGGFENWHKDGNVWYPNANGTSFWDTSNPGSAGLMGENYNVTTSATSPVHSGAYSAKLQSMYVIIKFAAASMYTGTFGSLNGTSSAKLNWGVPFTSRPSALHGYISYSPGAINRGSQPSGVGAPASGSNDVAQIRFALLTEALHVDNGDMSSFPAWDGSDSRVIAYGEYEQNTSDNGAWREITIPLTYYNTTRKPTHVLIVFSASKFGDYFYGSDSSCMYLDDFDFIYGE